MTIAISLLAYFTPWFLSVVFGVLIFTVPASMFAWFALKTSGVQKSKYVLANFFLGEMIKWGTTVVMFVGIYKHYAAYLKIEVLLGTYIIMHIINPLLMLTI